jgi:hypothetical protein
VNGDQIAHSLNIMLLIQNGCAEEPAKRFVQQFEEKCQEVTALKAALAARPDREGWMPRNDVLEECAKMAERLSTGVAVEVNGIQIPLGCMQHDQTHAQLATAHAIAAAIRGMRDHEQEVKG